MVPIQGFHTATLHTLNDTPSSDTQAVQKTDTAREVSALRGAANNNFSAQSLATQSAALSTQNLPLAQQATTNVTNQTLVSNTEINSRKEQLESKTEFNN